MKTILKLIFFLLIAQFAKAQSPFDSQRLVKSKLWVEYGYVQADSGMIIAKRDTLWTPRYAGTIVYWEHAGVDSLFWFYTGATLGRKWQQVGIGTGVGSVTTITANNTNGFTWVITNPTTAPDITLSLQDAVANGSTKGQATFAAGDFNSVTGLISLDYTNMQVASGSQPGILSTTLFNTFNGKENVLTFNSPLTRATNSISINNAAADGTNKGAMAGVAADFNATNGIFSIDYVNGQKASATQPGLLTAADWISFSELDSLVVTNAGADGFGIIYTNVLGDTLFGKKIRAGAGALITQETDSSLTISLAAGTAGYATIQEEGTPLTQRGTFNFIGANVTATDNGGSTRTDVTFSPASQSAAGYVSLGAQKLGTGTKIVDTLSINEASYPINTMLYVKGTAGTTAPVYVKTTGTTDNFVRIESDSRAWVVGAGGSAGGVSLPGSLVFRDLSAPGTRMSINTTGDVTINDLSGSGNRLVVASATGVLGPAVIGAGLNFDGTTLTSTGSGDVISDLGSTTLGYVAVANNADAKHITFVSQLPNANIVDFKSYPAQGTIGTIYEKSSWTAAEMNSEFTGVNGVTFSLNGNFVRNTSATIDWGTYGRWKPKFAFCLPKWQFIVDYQIVSALASNVGFGPAMRSNNVNGANYGYSSYLSASSSTATPHLAKEDGTADQTGSTFSISVNDVIRMTLTFTDSVLVLTAQNLTTASAVSTVTKTFVAGAAPYVPNTGTLGFQNFSGTYEIRYMKFSSLATKTPNIGVYFDSKAQIVTANFGRRFASRLNATYPTVINSSGVGDQLKDLLDRRDEINLTNPEKVWIGLGSNDIRYGSSLATTISRLENVIKMFSGSSTQWYISVIPEDSTAGGLGLTALKNYIAATYPSNYIDLWTFMSTSNVLKAAYSSDGVHPTDEGHRIIDSLAIASGLLTVISTNRRTPYAKNDGAVVFTGDSLHLSFKVNKGPNLIPRFNDSVDLVPSMFYHDATKIIVSAATPVQFASAFYTISGDLALNGGSAALVFQDRNNSSNRGALYMNNDVIRFGRNGTDIGPFISSIGQVKIGTDIAEQTFLGQLHLSESYSFVTGTQLANGLAINVDAATYTMSSPAAGTTFVGNSIGLPTVASSPSGSYTNAYTFRILGPPVQGSNMTLGTLYSLFIDAGNNHIGGELHIGSTTDAGAFTLQNTGSSYLNGQVGVKALPNATGASMTIGISDYASSVTTSMMINTGTSNDAITAGSGTIAELAVMRIGQTTRTSTNSSITHTIDASLLIDGPPIAGSNTTITNSLSLYVKTGQARFDAAIKIVDGNQGSGKVLTSDANGLASWQTVGYASGTYTPTLTNVTNVAANTAYQCQYLRVGDVVHVSGRVNIDPTSTGSTKLGVSLPLAATFGVPGDCGGTGMTPDIAGQAFAIYADVANSRVEIAFTATSTADQTYYFTFTYYISPS